MKTLSFILSVTLVIFVGCAGGSRGTGSFNKFGDDKKIGKACCSKYSDCGRCEKSKSCNKCENKSCNK